MKITDLVKVLNDIKKEVGNVEVYLSSDSEGNSYSTTNADRGFYWDKEKAVIYPWQEGIDLEFEQKGE